MPGGIGKGALAVAVVVLAILGPAAPSLAACTASDSGVVDVSHTPTRPEGEESVSIDPQNLSWVMAGANEGPNGGGANGTNETPAWWSHDAGCTWHAVLPDNGGVDLGSVLGPVGPLAPEFKEVGNVLTADQDSAWDNHGNVYFSDIQVSGVREGDNAIRVAHSGDGGMTWEPPVTAFRGGTEPPPVGTEYALGGIPLDRPWLAVDRSGGPRDGTVYVTWETSPFSPGLPPEVFASASTDHGHTWSRAVRVDDSTYTTQFNPRQFPSVGADGTLYDVYDLAGPTTTVAPGVQGGTIKLALGVSTDGAQTFRRSEVDPDVHRLADPDEATPQYSETISNLAADPYHAGRLAVVWPEALSSTNSRVELRTSVDGGRTWSPRVDVADDPAGRDDQHDHVAASFAPDGHLYVEWRDRRNGGGSYSAPYDVWARQLTLGADNSTRRGPVVRLTDRPQPANDIGKSNREGTLSEFLGMATARNTLVTAFNQVEGSLTDTVFRRISLDAFSQAAAQSRGGGSCHGRHTFTVHLRGPRGRVRITRVAVYANHRRLRVRLVRHGRRILIPLRNLPAGTVHVRLVIFKSNRHRDVDHRTYHVCGSRRAPS